jgi:uncharacterized integral membrane protein
MLKQAHWRMMGVAFLLGSGIMAVASVVTPILRNTLILILSLNNEDAAVQAELLSPWGYVLYWILFAAFVLGALYMAMLDIRFIRLEYAIAKRDLMREALGDAVGAPAPPNQPGASGSDDT